MTVPKAALLTLSLLSLGSIPLAGQTGTGPPHKTSSGQLTKATAASHPVSKYLTHAIDRNITSLGPNFVGNDIAAIVKTMQASSALKAKSEFETTVDYKKRRLDFYNHALYAQLYPWDDLAFVIQINSSSFRYDADEQELHVMLDARRPHSFDNNVWFFSDADLLEEAINRHDPPSMNLVSVRSTKLKSHQYIGGNAFGATLPIDATSYHDYDIAFVETSWLHDSVDFQTSGYMFHMAQEEAIELTKAPGILIISHLVEPLYGNGWHSVKPTFDLPIDTHTDFDYLRVVPNELWIFNQRTGVVYRKLKDGECYYSTSPVSQSSNNVSEQQHSDCLAQK